MIGEVGGKEKNTLLRDAPALLFPIQWREPFALVMIEALACGTPVLRNGSVPEVIDDGLTGWIVDGEDELVAAVDRIGELDRASCRTEVEKRFSAQRMALAYESIYSRFVGPARKKTTGGGYRSEFARAWHWPQQTISAID